MEQGNNRAQNTVKVNGRFLIIAQREVRDALTDWRIAAPMFILSLGFPIIILYSIQVGIPLLRQPDTIANIVKMVPFGALMAGFLPTSFSIVIALESFVGEKERNTLEPLLATPLADWELYLGKLVATLIPPLLLSYVAITIFNVGIRWILHFSLPAQTIFQLVVLSSLGALVMVCGAVVVSTHAASVRAANLLASFIILPMTFLVAGESLLMLMGYDDLLWWVMAGLVVVAFILLRLGIRVFNREEVLSSETQEVSLATIWRDLTRFLRSPALTHEAWHMNPTMPGGLLRLYAYDLPRLIAGNWGPLLMVVGAMVAATLIGYWFAHAYPLPLGAEMLGRLLRRWSLPLTPVPTYDPQTFFWHNLRATILAGFFASFTFGVTAVFYAMLPMGLAGFMAGEVAQAGYNPLVFLAAFILPHGVVELTAAALAAAFGLRLGMSIMDPPRGFTVGQAFLLALANYLKILSLVIPLLVIAALLEAYLTPQVVAWVYRH